MEHPYQKLISKTLAYTPAESRLLNSIAAVQRQHPERSGEIIYDQFKLEWILLSELWATDRFLLLDILQHVKLQSDVLQNVSTKLTHVEEQLGTLSGQAARIQADNDKLVLQVAELKTNQTALSDAITAANARFQADLDALIAAGNNEQALSAVADSMEANIASLQETSDALAAGATAEGQVDAHNPPPPPPSFTVSPSSANVAPGATQQFSASAPATWTAQSGSVDNNGMYTAPPDPSITSDVVTATNQADGTQASASVTIG